MVQQSTRLATDAELTRRGVTSQRYLRYLQQQSHALKKKQMLAEKWCREGDSATIPAETAYLDRDESTLVTASTEGAARSAVGATLQAVEAVMAGRWSHAFVAARPPGHHNGCCEALETWDPGGHAYACHGGCVLNETAVAIRHAQHLHQV